MPLQMFKKVESPPLSRISSVIAIAAGKGGVGKSTVTVHLAHTLKRAGYSVGVLDADIYGPSIRRMLPEEQKPSQDGEEITPAISNGIKTISMAYFRKEPEASAVRAPIANGIITQFLKNVHWGPLDFLLIDFPPGTGDIQLTLSQQANLTGAIMVTTPQEVALMDVRKASDMFNKVGVPIVGVVENMSYYQENPSSEKKYLFGKGGAEKLSLEIGAPFLGGIPIDGRICESGDQGLPLTAMKETPEASIQAFDTIAKNFVAHLTTLKRLSKETLSSFELNWKEM